MSWALSREINRTDRMSWSYTGAAVIVVVPDYCADVTVQMLLSLVFF